MSDCWVDGKSQKTWSSQPLASLARDESPCRWLTPPSQVVARAAGHRLWAPWWTASLLLPAAGPLPSRPWGGEERGPVPRIPSSYPAEEWFWAHC